MKRGLWPEGQAGRAEVWLAGDMLNCAETCSCLALAWVAHHVGVTNVANHGSQTIAAGGDWTRSNWITRKASWPLAQRGALVLLNPGVIEALHSDCYNTIFIIWFLYISPLPLYMKTVFTKTEKVKKIDKQITEHRIINDWMENGIKGSRIGYNLR